MQNSAAPAVNSGAVSSDPAASTFFERHKKWLIASVLFGMYVSFGMSWMGVVPILQELQVAFQFDKASGSWLVSIVSMAKSIFPDFSGYFSQPLGTNSQHGSGVLF